MAIEICPHCKDFTEQSHLASMESLENETKGIESVTNISICHCCGQSIEHEIVSMMTIACQEHQMIHAESFYI
ncbi:MAG: hypothetical protein ACE5D7_10280 [Fidelibacterota bacterium]